MKFIEEAQLEETLTKAIHECKPDKIFVLTDTTTKQVCMPKICEMECLKSHTDIVIEEGDTNKNLEAVKKVWEELQAGGATRHSLLINLGGGMVTDLGGFAASCFKRGISFINIPTTLLSMVDASTGGKTGVNFGLFKNEIGVFSDAHEVIICTAFLETLDNRNILSGYAEMLKHEIISGKLRFADYKTDIEESVAVKTRIVSADPHEHGLRKVLNLGHTIGHAIETWHMKHNNPILHGYAVAWGLVAELYLAVVKCHYPTDKLRLVSRFVRENYGDCPITCDDYPELLSLMLHDKKNTAGQGINFTLLNKEEEILINQTATEEEIKEALDFLREG